MNNWQLIKNFRDGHSYWYKLDVISSQKVAIADQSGNYIPCKPDTTEDGVLWVDCSHPLIPNSSGFGWILRLYDSENKSYSTIVSTSEAKWLNTQFGLRIVIED